MENSTYTYKGYTLIIIPAIIPESFLYKVIGKPQLTHILNMRPPYKLRPRYECDVVGAMEYFRAIVDEQESPKGFSPEKSAINTLIAQVKKQAERENRDALE